MNKPLNLTQMQTYITQAEQYLNESVSTLKQVKLAEQSTSLEDLLHMKLILQYRLSTASALKTMFQLERTACEILGISPQHSIDTNLERLMYMVGDEELHHMLAMITQLLDALERIVQKLQKDASEKAAAQHKKQAESAAKKLAHNSSYRTENNLRIAIEKQEMAQANLALLLADVERVAGQVQPGPIFDHIGAITGPISRFYQVIQHGFGLSYTLYIQAKQHEKINLYVNSLLNQTQHILNPPTPIIKQNLEERASEKRLGHFFHL
ncbi:MAG: hypothetical protein A3F18_08545 [Legionellales bacterium RIFCSPHIGHO2_12_FULL_37_14]|nr:MAG: hypothetical protein A3F18_08545 [Legionellales bacterium RIFCSPHIGHO2_12_FULL_37_14]